MQPSEIAIIGLGYVGLPVAAAFAKDLKVVGFDISKSRVKELQGGHDRTNEVSDDELKNAKGLTFTTEPKDLSRSDVIIVCVPTPVDGSNRPDFTPLEKASETVGKTMKKGAIVVYESTVYPGATEEICIPILEKMSGFTWKRDFFVGYSPERINPGDKIHTLATVKKIVAGDTADTLKILSALYGRIVKAGVFEAESLKVAEAAKILENTQRDINIALMNECAMIFRKMGIDTQAVLEAARTKWNFLDFRPGLVGGHCIGVDPYYLTEKSVALGHHPAVILAGRRTNDGMGKWVADETVKLMIQTGSRVKGSKVAIFGLTFKENVPDLRNSKVADLITVLKTYGVEPYVTDALADPKEALHEYGVELTSIEKVPECEAVVLAVPHATYKSEGLGFLRGKLRAGGVFVDLKALFSRADVEKAGYKSLRM